MLLNIENNDRKKLSRNRLKKDTSKKYKLEDEIDNLNDNENIKREIEYVNSNKSLLPISVIHLNKDFNVEISDTKVKDYINNKKTFKYGEVHPSPYIASQYIKTVIEDVTFCVKENECFGLLGPNGVGKSTIFNILISNFKMTTGGIYFNGIDHYKSNNIIGYCSQANVLWDELTESKIIP
ncbi:hypothetical protein PIROE2DRAFT_14434 [Piromyces sp. E2]|nr:hypothetical protein PIROE2DRAFT_14434 [Piromyces sp. E2]|eukprot:OUM59911.1 hypothetical protein PIROE2DRAFT_14434 [Piromyces sp. E2]